MSTEMQPSNGKALTPVDRMKSALSAESVQQQFRNALADNAPLFIASLIDVYASDSKLQRCSPGLVIMEALKAATLKLPINKNLGFAYIIPYDKSKKVGDKWEKVSIPQFQAGYKAFIQLAMRTGQYRYINADMVYEGEKVESNRITGALTITGEPSGEKVIGYFAYFETLNGFSKALFWTIDRVTAHAKRFSKSYEYKDSAWQTAPDEMGMKTVLKALLSKYGILSVEMVSAITDDRDDEAEAQAEVDQNANQDILDIEVTESTLPPHNGSTHAEQQMEQAPY